MVDALRRVGARHEDPAQPRPRGWPPTTRRAAGCWRASHSKTRCAIRWSRPRPPSARSRSPARAEIAPPSPSHCSEKRHCASRRTTSTTAGSPSGELRDLAPVDRRGDALLHLRHRCRRRHPGRRRGPGRVQRERSRRDRRALRDLSHALERRDPAQLESRARRRLLRRGAVHRADLRVRCRAQHRPRRKPRARAALLRGLATGPARRHPAGRPGRHTTGTATACRP